MVELWELLNSQVSCIADQWTPTRTVGGCRAFCHETPEMTGQRCPIELKLMKVANQLNQNSDQFKNLTENESDGHLTRRKSATGWKKSFIKLSVILQNHRQASCWSEFNLKTTHCFRASARASNQVLCGPGRPMCHAEWMLLHHRWTELFGSPTMPWIEMRQLLLSSELTTPTDTASPRPISRSIIYRIFTVIPLGNVTLANCNYQIGFEIWSMVKCVNCNFYVI